MSPTGRPKISVIIPTYNREKLLRETLLKLIRQSLPVDEFEVIVSDDGSSDGTREVVDSFSGRLRLGYHFQEDLGFRVATARNEGARLATAPVLCFIDAGELPGPGFLSGHLAEHTDEQVHAAVAGYCYGYDPRADPLPGLAELLGTLSPEEVVARLGDDPAFHDLRHKGFTLCGFDLSRRPIPWDLLWGGNFSVRTDDFWGVGGFDDSFTAWGGEDLDLALRLYRRRLTFRIARDGWVIEWPHARVDASVKEQQFKENLQRCVRRRPDPAMEIGPGMMTAGIPMFRWGYLVRDLEEWSEKARDLTVTSEIAAAAASVSPGAMPAGSRVAVLGCGGVLPASLAPAVLLDFDRGLLDQALAGGRHTGYHSIGLRTPLDDQSVDAVIITSRLSGLWECWHQALTREAERIGKQVIRTFGQPFNAAGGGD